MRTCPHCGQAVRSEGPRCPLCRQDMHGASSLPETTAPALHSEATHSPMTGSTELERLWEGKSDDALEEAIQDFASYTEEGQRVIRAELQRRSMEAPVPEEARGQRDEFVEPWQNGGMPTPRCWFPSRWWSLSQ